ncbi:MAG: glycosyltransferase [Salibacteraceae bacterium]
MLSILIPIYNYDVRGFVRQLLDQAEQVGFEVEIRCLDDASEASFKELNAEIGQWRGVVLDYAETNLGRSKARNTLVHGALFEHLLFLDCDGACLDDSYLAKYAKVWNKYDVVYGGRVYSEEAPDDHDLYFHWYVGSNREAIDSEQRLLNPYKSFMTNNFLIRKSVFNAIKMDETLVGYGHEDTLFAQELKRAGFQINHIDNPIMHCGLESFHEFFRKSENGIRNLGTLIERNQVDDSIRLVRYYNHLKKWSLLGPISSIVQTFEERLKANLKGPAPNLLWFDLWKLSKLREFSKNR